MPRDLTEEHNNVLVFGQDLLQHLDVHFLNLAGNFERFLIGQPGQNLILVVQIARVDQRVLVAEEHQRWQVLDVVLLGSD